ncbi:Zn(II)2Cys6 transcription factor [Aspergillus clavatus NRRL 1]|uniref:C6 finger domain protein, putative n=1 Tax=Aspergillus clavatus (strain ATCC 1007 / CBS 513.65 / DSM 816 / NCTC 3887 / NRRL 1 / QM 1276 / 107) TaxID=344612 RepID=A1CSD5_ASPCL|nr:C6 finger domain protein, putative [Aspergillus clavatus NRRL 1]EAW08556.1 C6 finger domain protein, putative [Aspergillus clavatus NRRL 1]
MSESERNQQQQDVPASSVIAKAGTRKKIRPTYSCLNCHKRKVKCDRVKPCGACCLRGTPSECEYGTSKRDRHYIQQSALIENLMQTCEDLKTQLAEARALANLPPLKEEDAASVSSPSSHSLARSEKTTFYEEDDRGEVVGPHITPSIKQPSSLLKELPSKESEELSSWKAYALSGEGRPDRVADQMSRSPSHDKKVLTDPALANSLIELFVERLIDNFSPQPAEVYGGTIALREASGMRVFSPLLCSAFEAACLTFAGRRHQIREVETVGHARYVRVLRLLQTALNDPKQSKSTEVLVVVLLFTIIEVIPVLPSYAFQAAERYQAFKQSSKDSLLNHQLGGLQLLQSRTPYRHRYGIERSLYVDLRLYWVTAALVKRKPTFLASKEWLTVPWPGDAPSKDIQHRLLDIAVDIPAYLAQVDEFADALKSGTTSSSELVSIQSSIWERAAELHSRLRLWKSMFADTDPHGQPWEESNTNSESDFPIFRCRNPTTMEVVTAQLLMYPNAMAATCMTYYWALDLIISTPDSGLASMLSPQERYQRACNICRSMKYYCESVPGYLVSRIMFVLRTAFDAFSDGMIEKQFAADVFRYIGDKFQFAVFSNHCASSSVKS